jgi:hypothetical protein
VGWAIVHCGVFPPFPTAKRRPPADGEQRKLQPGDQPSDQICAKEEEQQASKKKHVVQCAHSHLFLMVFRDCAATALAQYMRIMTTPKKRNNNNVRILSTAIYGWIPSTFTT